MQGFVSSFLVALSALFVVVDPIAVAPLATMMTEGRPRGEVRSLLRRGSVVGAGLLLFFTLFGGLLFRILRVDLSAFRVAGGLLLLLTALDMLRARVSECKCTKREVEVGARKDDIAIVPLATPLLAGPGAIATVMVLSAERPGLLSVLPIGAAIVVTFASGYYILRAGELIKRALNTSGMALVQRIMGLILAAVAVQFIAEGARRLWA
jgi:multiple antibiotic resistance protein